MIQKIVFKKSAFKKVNSNNNNLKKIVILKNFIITILKFNINVNNCFHFEMKNYLQPKTTWIHDKQFWNKKIKRTPLNEFFSEVEDLSNYDDRQVSQISNTQFISNSRKLPSLTFVR